MTIVEQYAAGMSTLEIADNRNWSVSSVRNHLLKAGVKMRGRLDWRKTNPEKCSDFELCECYLEPGEPCPNAATRIMEEPWTPARFKTLCCDSCAEGKRSLGYHDRGNASK